MEKILLNKLKKIFVEGSLALVVLFGTYSLTNKDLKVKADEVSQVPQENQEIQPNNHPMGYFAMGKSAETTNFQILRASPATSTEPSDLYSDDTSLPRKDAIDVASYQFWLTQADFNTIKASGVKTVVVKLTEGTSYTNPYAKSQIKMAQAAGLIVAAYHFVDDPSNIKAEGNYFASVAKSLGLSSQTVMIEDAEVKASSAWTDASLEFAKTLKAAGYNYVKYYTSASWISSNYMAPSKLGERNMWVAQYLYGKPSAEKLQNTKYGAWQFTSQMYYVGASQKSYIDTSIDYSNFFSEKPNPAPAPAGYSNVYRMYNPNTGEHLYTESYYEMSVNVDNGWDYEGVGWYAPKSGGSSVYRIYNPNAQGGDHYYTKSLYEAKKRVEEGWHWDNDGKAVFYSSGNTPVYVAYNPNATSGAHNYTINAFEQKSLLNEGWKFGAVAWYGK